MNFGQLIERYFRLGIAVADQLLVSGASFVTTLLIARFLGTVEFGRFVLVWLAVLAVNNIQIALILTPFTTFAAREPDAQRAAYFGAVAVQQGAFALLTAAITLLVTLAVAYFLPDDRLYALAGPLSLVVLFGQCTDLLRRYFYINERAPIAFATDIARYGTQLAALIVLLVKFPAIAALPTVLVTIAISALIGALVGWLFVTPLAFEREAIKQVTIRHWSYSRWLLGSTLISSARESFVGFSIGGWLGLTEVGAMRAVQQLVQIINVPLFVMHNIVPARASRAYGEEGFGGLIAYMRTIALRYIVFLGVVLLVVGTFGELLLTTFYGKGFAGYGYLVAAYALITMIFLARDFVTIIVKTFEKTNYDFLTNVIGASLSLVLLYPLLRAFGLPGAVLAEGCAHLGMLLAISTGLLRQWKHQAGRS